MQLQLWRYRQFRLSLRLLELNFLVEVTTRHFQQIRGSHYQTFGQSKFPIRKLRYPVAQQCFSSVNRPETQRYFSPPKDPPLTLLSALWGVSRWKFSRQFFVKSLGYLSSVVCNKLFVCSDKSASRNIISE